MTVQCKEILKYRGRAFGMFDCPLGQCPDLGVRERMRRFVMPSTALRRGYHGTWEIRAGRLWLADLTATIREPDATIDQWQTAERGIQWLFPNESGPVFADWVTGTLDSPRGRWKYPGEFSCSWPYIRVFRVERGIVIGTELVDNRANMKAGFSIGVGVRKYLESL